MPERGALPRGATLVGAGKMGSALLHGWLKAGLEPASTRVLEPNPSPELTALCNGHGVGLNGSGREPAGILILAIKPQGLAETAPTLAPLIGPDTLVLSILAGKTTADLRQRLNGARAIVRAMPNLPASIGRGATGAVASPDVTPAQHAGADTLLRCAGHLEWLDDEALLDAVTAVSGSGPAYVALLAEALGAAGIAAGLPPETALRLARATVSGTGALLEQDTREAAQLRVDVTSPGGTTAAALAVLMRANGLPDLVREAVVAAKRRAVELAG